MKNFSLALGCSIVALLCSQCSKDNVTPANTIKLEINGIAFDADISRSKLTVDDSAKTIKLDILGKDGTTQLWFGTTSFNSGYDPYSPRLYKGEWETSGRYLAFFTNYYVACSGRTLDGAQTYETNSCFSQSDLIFEVKKVNTKARVISGTFSGTFCKNGCDRKEVRKGEFNLPY